MLGSILFLTLFGLVLIMLETFVPGWISGILGGLCILAAVGLTLGAEEFQGWEPWQRGTLAAGIVVFSIVVLLLWMRFFATRLFRRAFTLQAELPKTVLEAVVTQGAEGVSLTELRPLGRAEFGSERREVRSQDGFVPAGVKVRVVGVEPGNLIVRRVL